jgi:hypothetical protein
MTTLDRFRFNRYDPLKIVTDPASATKAFAASAVAVATKYLTTKGVEVPDEIVLEATGIIEWAGTALIAFAVTWLFPNLPKRDRVQLDTPRGDFRPSLSAESYRDEA